mgnify:CR=1 FL=1
MDVEDKKESKQKLTIPIRALVVIVAIVIAAAVIVLSVTNRKEEPPEIITVSTLQKIVNVSELSTYTAVYNGITKVMNEKDPGDIDYYVSYEAKVYAGIDLDAVKISVDESVDQDAKTILIEIPEVEITNIVVDISSMDFIFYNEEANTSTVSQEAYKACEADVKQECLQQNAIYELARQNASNILKALIVPIVDQADEEYRLVIA